MTPFEATQELSLIVLRTNTGGLTYDEGKSMALPFLKIINDKQAEIAKKYNKKPAPISWGYCLRTGLQH